MENVIVNKYMRLIEPLSLETKLELVAKIVENLKSGIAKPIPNKENLLDDLYGAWSDMDDVVINDILNSRMSAVNKQIFNNRIVTNELPSMG